MLSERKAMNFEHGYCLDPEDTKPVSANMSLMVWSLGHHGRSIKDAGFQGLRIAGRLRWPSFS